MLYTQGTKMIMDTSCLHKRCKGSTNVNLYFQGMMSLGVSYLGTALTHCKIENGMIKLREVSTKPRPLDKIKTNQITCFFKEEFIKRYIKIEGHWPELDVSQLSPTNIIRLAYENQSPYPKGRSSVIS